MILFTSNYISLLWGILILLMGWVLIIWYLSKINLSIPTIFYFLLYKLSNNNPLLPIVILLPIILVLLVYNSIKQIKQIKASIIDVYENGICGIGSMDYHDNDSVVNFFQMPYDEIQNIKAFENHVEIETVVHIQKTSMIGTLRNRVYIVTLKCYVENPMKIEQIILEQKRICMQGENCMQNDNQRLRVYNQEI